MTSRRRRLPGVLGLVAVTLLATAAAHASSGSPGRSVTVDRTRISTELGRTFVFRSTLANGDSAPAGGLVAHLNVVSLDDGVYVDPEDWSTHRTRYLRPVGPGGSQTLSWRLKAVNSGKFAVYVAVFHRTGDARPPTTSPLVAVAVAGRTTLNAGGILSVALGVPALLGVLTIGLGLRRRRSA
jgi:hypothetical protein